MAKTKRSKVIPLPVLKHRLARLENIVARRQAAGGRQPKNKIPLLVLERRLGRLGRIIAKRA